MNHERFTRYIIETIRLLKEQARTAKKEARNLKEDVEEYCQGVLMGYYSIISLFKHQAFIFCIGQKELGLADIRPGTDLLNLPRNSHADFEEEDWRTDALYEEKAIGYISYVILMLKYEARQAKKNADNSQQGESAEFNQGCLMAYHETIATMKEQAHIFGLEHEDISLADIDPKADLTCVLSSSA